MSLLTGRSIYDRVLVMSFFLSGKLLIFTTAVLWNEALIGQRTVELQPYVTSKVRRHSQLFLLCSACERKECVLVQSPEGLMVI